MWSSSQLTVSPPLDEEEVKYLLEFSRTLHLERSRGDYHLDEGSIWCFAGGPNWDVIKYDPPGEQPSTRCGWFATRDGRHILWDVNDQEYGFDDDINVVGPWLSYLIKHFLKPGAEAIGVVPGIKGGHTLNGDFVAQENDPLFRWRIIVKDNRITESGGSWVWDDADADQPKRTYLPSSWRP